MPAQRASAENGFAPPMQPEAIALIRGEDWGLIDTVVVPSSAARATRRCSSKVRADDASAVTVHRRRVRVEMRGVDDARRGGDSAIELGAAEGPGESGLREDEESSRETWP